MLVILKFWNRSCIRRTRENWRNFTSRRGALSFLQGHQQLATPLFTSFSMQFSSFPSSFPSPSEPFVSYSISVTKPKQLYQYVKRAYRHQTWNFVSHFTFFWIEEVITANYSIHLAFKPFLLWVFTCSNVSASQLLVLMSTKSPNNVY